MSNSLKQFFEGCVAVADGLERAKGAFGGRRQSQGQHGQPRGQVIDVAGSESEFASYGSPMQGEQVMAPQNSSVPPSGMTVAHHDVKTIDERVAFIIQMIQKGRDSAEVRRFAVQAISKRCGNKWCVKEGDGEAEVKALFAACQKYYRYCSDTYGKDLFQHPERTLEFGGGDCDDATILICSALGSVGFATKCRVIRTHNAREWNHIYALVGLPQKSPSKWVPLDLSVSSKPPGWQPDRSQVAAVKDFDVPLVR